MLKGINAYLTEHVEKIAFVIHMGEPVWFFICIS